MNSTSSNLVSSRGLPNLARTRVLPGGKAYRPFDRPAGSPLFVASDLTADGSSRAVQLRLVKSSLFGTAPEPYGVLEVVLVPTTIPDGVTLAVPRSVTASLVRLIDRQGATTGFDSDMSSDGSLLDAYRLRFQWVLDQHTSAQFASALTQGLQLFEITVHWQFDAVNVDRDTVGSGPEPDVVPLETFAQVQLADSAAGNVVATVDEVDVSPLPNGSWRIEVDSVLELPVAGIERLGVQFTVPANPPNRPSTAEAVAWLQMPDPPVATLRLSPLEPKSGHACVIALARSSTGFHTLTGPSREHHGSLFMIRPDDFPLDTVRLRAEQALLDQGTLFIDVTGSDGRSLYGSTLDTSGVSLAVIDSAHARLVARSTSTETGETVISTAWPFRSGVVDRAWFAGFGSGSTWISTAGNHRGAAPELLIRLTGQTIDQATLLRPGDRAHAAQWRYLNTGPYTPRCLYRVMHNGSNLTDWSDPVTLTGHMQLTPQDGHWQLMAIEEQPEPATGEPVDPDTPNTPNTGDDITGNVPGVDDTDPTQEPAMGGTHNETINGIECQWDDENPTRLSYKPPALRPELNARGEPLVSLIVAGGKVSVQVSVQWALPSDELVALRAAFAQRVDANVALISLGIQDVGPITAELISIDEAGQRSVIATTPTAGFGSQSAALQASGTAPEIHSALSAAFAGESDRLLVRYHAAELDLTADIGQWLAASPISHITTIPGQ